MKKIEYLNVIFRDRPVGTLSMSPDNKTCVFEYDKSWLTDGFSLSPLELPLKAGIFIAKPTPFAGNFGVFDDSLPDGYGRYLLHKALIKEGIDDSTLTVLDRLGIIGSAGMGGLSYVPSLNIINTQEVLDFDLLQEKALEVLKERQNDDAELLLYNSGNSGGARPKALFSDSDGHWLIKFRHTYDPFDIGQQEFRYNEAAHQSGIDIPDFKLIEGKYFASRRFDIDSDGKRLHTVTAGGLLSVSLAMPILDYSNLVALTGYLTHNIDDVKQMFRRMIFNYLTDNKDDHCKNFSFIIIRNSSGQWVWRLAPAYDLTLCTEGYNGQHATSVNHKDKPQLADFLSVGVKGKLSERECLKIIDEVKTGCQCIQRYDF